MKERAKIIEFDDFLKQLDSKIEQKKNNPDKLGALSSFQVNQEAKLFYTELTGKRADPRTGNYKRFVLDVFKQYS